MTRATGTPAGPVADPVADVVADLVAALGRDRVLDTPLDRHARAHDASHYLMVPRAVVRADGADAVARTLAAATRHRTPVTFRSGGTSLSGQAVGAGLLVDTRRGLRRVEVLDDGMRVRAEPGATLRDVNVRLARHGRALGPDPASEVACTVGGIIANNSSGMAAGTELNSYRTLESVRVVLASGTVVDSAAPDAAERLRRDEPGLVAALEALRDRVRGDPAVVDEIRERFAMKNTMGYAVNAFLDFDEPLDVLVHLLVGSEGTLGFVAEAVFRTVPVEPDGATGLIVLDSVEAAVAALPALLTTGVAALELMDATSLRVARRDPAAPPEILGFDIDGHAALLVEYRAGDAAALAVRTAAARPVLDGLPAVVPVRLTSDAAARAALWRVRKGLYAAVAGARPSGTTALLEDVVVPVGRLADTCRELTALIAAAGYPDAVIFGHAKDGNLHFMITDDFERPGAVDRLAGFTEELVDLVLRHGGNLKAEHGTGRAMAPFVPRQYGAAVVDVMRAVKQAFDPAGILNPGVVLTDDSAAHLHDLKPVDTVDAEVDRCVECGYCEPVCPSRDLTLTPRQRIAARRARARALSDGDADLVAALDRQFQYDGVDTCAADGMCQTACPVRIDTGSLVKRLRAEGRSAAGQRAWRGAADRWAAVTGAAATALTVAGRVPAPLVEIPDRAARALLGHENVPRWTPDLPAGGRRRGATGRPGVRSEPAAVFLPSCQGALFAPGDPAAAPQGGVQAAVLALCDAAGIEVAVPEGIDGLCCGTPWTSKGYRDGHDVMAQRVLDQVAAVRGSREIPVIVDASSCAEGLAHVMAAAREAGDPRAADVVDAVEFVAARVLPLLAPLADADRLPSLALHPTCSSRRQGVDGHLVAVARAVARTVQVPDDWGCCGFAGDRGMLHPELTAAATAPEAAEVRRLDAAAHASCNRACEIAMTRATGRTYRHVLELAAERFGVA